MGWLRGETVPLIMQEDLLHKKKELDGLCRLSLVVATLSPKIKGTTDFLKAANTETLSLPPLSCLSLCRLPFPLISGYWLWVNISGRFPKVEMVQCCTVSRPIC